MNIINRSILWGGLMTFSLINITNVNAQTCAIPPSCETLGYTMKLSECEELDHLKCPFDMSKVYCNKKPKPLELGDQIFSGDVFDIVEKEGRKAVSTVQIMSGKLYSDNITHAECKEACSNLADTSLPTIAEVIKLEEYTAPGGTQTYLKSNFLGTNYQTTGGCMSFYSTGTVNTCASYEKNGNCLCIAHYVF